MRLPALLVAAPLAAVSACRTQEIGELHSQYSQTSSDQGALVIVTSAPADDKSVEYVVFIDGRVLVNDFDLWPSHRTISNGLTKVGFIEAGPHHFALADETGGPFWFEGDVVMPAGALTRLYTFGARRRAQPW